MMMLTLLALLVTIAAKANALMLVMKKTGHR